MSTQRKPQTSDERAAAYREHDEQLSKAWKADPEFGNVLNLAISIGVTKPLRDYVEAGKPVPNEQVLVGGESIPMHALVAELLCGLHQLHQQKRGRPHRVASKVPSAEQAERNAAWLVAFAQKDWRKRNARERVPRLETEEMIRAAIKEAAKAFGVPVSTINASNIRNVLKNRRVVVP